MFARLPSSIISEYKEDNCDYITEEGKKKKNYLLFPEVKLKHSGNGCDYFVKSAVQTVPQ